MTQRSMIRLSDGTGGLNLRDPKSALTPTQFAHLENYITDDGAYLKKRLGQELLQYAPINSQPFTATPNSIGLWTLSEDTLPFDDTGIGGSGVPDNYLMASTGMGPLPNVPFVPVQGIFGNAQELFGYGSNPNDPGSEQSLKSFFNFTNSLVDGLQTCTYECWIKIPPYYTGKPHTGSAITGGLYISDSNSNLLTTSSQDNVQNVETQLSTASNGLILFRDWDYTNGKDASAPYFVFAVNTNQGRFTVKSGALPIGSWIHLRGVFNSTTGFMKVFLSGNLLNQISIPLGSVIYEKSPNSHDFMVNVGPVFASYVNTVTGAYLGTSDAIILGGGDIQICQCQISNIEVLTFPYYEPRGKPLVLTTSNGTNQLIVAAGPALWYTVGDGNWTMISNTDAATGAPLNQVAVWDGVQLGDRLYLTNGVNQPITWNGAVACPTGNPVAAMTLADSGVGSTHTNGAFNYVYTYVYGNTETGFSPATQITIFNSHTVNMTGIQGRDINCTSINIYRTKAGLGTYYLLRNIPNPGLGNTASLTGAWINGNQPNLDTGGDGVPDGSTSGELNDNPSYPTVDPNVQTSTVPLGAWYLPEHNRLFIIGIVNAPYSLYWSELGNPDVVLANSFVNVSAEKGPLNGMASWMGEIILSKNAQATTVLRGTDPSNWVLTENVHPDVGCRHHWAFVRRYPIDSQQFYSLMFLGNDGIYAYNGLRPQRISDVINPLFQSLASSTQLDWLLTSGPDFTSQANGGTISQNIYSPTYTTDGLRQNPGNIEIVNQLEYIGLWKPSSPLVPGNVIAIEKGVAEGEFWFSTDQDNNLRHTTDNFVTVSLVAANPIPTQERIVSITKQGAADAYSILTDSNDVLGFASAVAGPASNVVVPVTYNPLNNRFAVTAYFGHPPTPVPSTLMDIYAADGVTLVEANVIITAVNIATITLSAITTSIPQGAYLYPSGSLRTSSGGGYVYTWNNATTAWINTRTNATPALYYDLDVPFVVALNDAGNFGTKLLGNSASPNGNIGSQGFSGVNNNTSNINVPNNHMQNVFLDAAVEGFSNDHNGGISFLEGIAIVAPASSPTQHVTLDGSQTIALTVNPNVIADGPFFNAQGWANPLTAPFMAAGVFPEFPLSDSGVLGLYGRLSYTHREFAVWQGGTFRPQAFWDTTNSRLVFLAASGDGGPMGVWTCTTGLALTKQSTTQNITAITTDGTHGYITVSDAGWNGTSGTRSGIWTFDLAAFGFVNQNAYQYDFTSQRLAITGGYITSIGKTYERYYSSSQVSNSFAVQQLQNYWDYSLGVGLVSPTYSWTLFNPNSVFPGTGAGPCAGEIGSFNGSYYVILQNSGNVYSMPSSAQALSDIAKFSEYLALYGGSATGIRSNLLAVPQSGPTGSNLWADRFYWMAFDPTGGNTTLVQLGVPGGWRVQGSFLTAPKNLGVFVAFGKFTTFYTGNIQFFMRNAATVGALLASELSATPNAQILGFPSPGIQAAWRALLVWDDIQTQVTPSIQFVDIAYLLGAISAPAPSAGFWEGRCYWALSNPGDTNNSFILVLDKKGAWTTYTGWPAKGLNVFRDQFVDIQGFEACYLETGNTDNGNPIVALARTGVISDGRLMGIEDIEANVSTTYDSNFPAKLGYVSIYPMQGDNMGVSPWILPLPSDPNTELQHSMAIPTVPMGRDWGKAFSMEIGTLINGQFAGYSAAVNQQEVIQQLEIKVLASVVGRNYAGK
jgi:hypothetical protein